MNEVHSPKKPLIFYYMVAMLLVMLFNFIAMPWLSQYQIQEVDYNTFVSMTEKGEIGRAEIQEADNRILFTSKDEKTIYKTAMISTDSQLVQRLLDAGVSTSGEEIEQTSLLMNILSWVAPILIFIALGQFMSRKLMQKMGGGNSMMFNMGKSNAKVYVKSAEGIRFDDVAGEDEAKENLTEIVNYLHDPSKYRKSQAFIAHKFSPFILSNFNMTIWPPSIPLVGSLRFPLLCSSCPLQFPPFSHVSHTAYADSPISRKQARKATSLLIYPSIFRG